MAALDNPTPRAVLVVLGVHNADELRPWITLARGLIGSKQGAKCAIITHAQYAPLLADAGVPFLHAGPCPFEARRSLPEGRALDSKVGSLKGGAQSNGSESWASSVSTFAQTALGCWLLGRLRLLEYQQHKIETLHAADLGGKLEAFMAALCRAWFKAGLEALQKLGQLGWPIDLCLLCGPTSVNVYSSVCDALQLRWAAADESPNVPTNAFQPPRGFSYEDSSFENDEAGNNDDEDDEEDEESSDGESSSSRHRRRRVKKRGDNSGRRSLRRSIWDQQLEASWGCLFRAAMNGCREDVFQGAANNPRACKFNAGSFRDLDAPGGASAFRLYLLEAGVTDCATCIARKQHLASRQSSQTNRSKASFSKRRKSGGSASELNKDCRMQRGLDTLEHPAGPWALLNQEGWLAGRGAAVPIFLFYHPALLPSPKDWPPSVRVCGPLLDDTALPVDVALGAFAGSPRTSATSTAQGEEMHVRFSGPGEGRSSSLENGGSSHGRPSEAMSVVSALSDGSASGGSMASIAIDASSNSHNSSSGAARLGVIAPVLPPLVHAFLCENYRGGGGRWGGSNNSSSSGSSGGRRGGAKGPLRGMAGDTVSGTAAAPVCFVHFGAAFERWSTPSSRQRVLGQCLTASRLAGYRTILVLGANTPPPPSAAIDGVHMNGGNSENSSSRGNNDSKNAGSGASAAAAAAALALFDPSAAKVGGSKLSLPPPPGPLGFLKASPAGDGGPSAWIAGTDCLVLRSFGPSALGGGSRNGSSSGLVALLAHCTVCIGRGDSSSIFASLVAGTPYQGVDFGRSDSAEAFWLHHLDAEHQGHDREGKGGVGRGASPGPPLKADPTSGIHTKALARLLARAADSHASCRQRARAASAALRQPVMPTGSEHKGSDWGATDSIAGGGAGGASGTDAQGRRGVRGWGRRPKNTAPVSASSTPVASSPLGSMSGPVAAVLAVVRPLAAARVQRAKRLQENLEIQRNSPPRPRPGDEKDDEDGSSGSEYSHVSEISSEVGGREAPLQRSSRHGRSPGKPTKPPPARRFTPPDIPANAEAPPPPPNQDSPVPLAAKSLNWDGEDVGEYDQSGDAGDEGYNNDDEGYYDEWGEWVNGQADEWYEGSPEDKWAEGDWGEYDSNWNEGYWDDNAGDWNEEYWDDSNGYYDAEGSWVENNLQDDPEATLKAEDSAKEEEAKLRLKEEAEKEEAKAKDIAEKEAAEKEKALLKEAAEREIALLKEAAEKEEARAKEAAEKEEARAKEAAEKEEAKAKEAAEKEEARAKETAEKEEAKAKEAAEKEEAKAKKAAEKEEARAKEAAEKEEARAKEAAEKEEAKSKRAAEKEEAKLKKAKEAAEKEEAKSKRVAEKKEAKAKETAEKVEAKAKQAAEKEEVRVKKAAEKEEAKAKQTAEKAKAKADKAALKREAAAAKAKASTKNTGPANEDWNYTESGGYYDDDGNWIDDESGGYWNDDGAWVETGGTDDAAQAEVGAIRSAEEESTAVVQKGASGDNGQWKGNDDDDHSNGDYDDQWNGEDDGAWNGDYDDQWNGDEGGYWDGNEWISDGKV